MPYDAVVREDERAKVVSSTGRTTVHRADGDDAEELIAHVKGLANAADPTFELMWPVFSFTKPEDLGQRLLAHGAGVAEELDINAFAFGTDTLALDAPGDITVRRIDDGSLLYDAHVVSAEVFGTPMPSEEFRAAEADNMLKQVALGEKREIFRYVAYDGQRPIGAGGFTYEDTVAKLWGGSVVESHRGRGVYRALLASRMDDAAAWGATLALVKARTGTSSPILRRAGFRAFGREYVYRVPLD